MAAELPSTEQIFSETSRLVPLIRRGALFWKEGAKSNRYGNISNKHVPIVLLCMKQIWGRTLHFFVFLFPLLQDEEDVSLRSYSYRRCLRKVRYRRRVRVRVRVLVQTCRIRIGYRWITRNKYAYRWTYRWVWAWRYISVRYNRWKQVCCGGRVLWKRRNWCCYYNRYYKPCRKG